MISFGTSYQNAIEKNIGIIEKQIQSYFNNSTVFRAFTSHMILNQLKKKSIQIDTIPQALEKIISQGYTTVVCQPTYIMHGKEYQKMLTQIQPYEQKINVRYANPLLYDTYDYQNVVEGIMAQNDFVTRQDALVLVGHGSQQNINSPYTMLEHCFATRGYPFVLVGIIEDYDSMDRILKKLERIAPNTVYIAPFMIVIGAHAHRDIFGEHKNTWKSCIEHKGYCVKPILKGLGEYPAICSIFIKHIQNVL